MRELLLPGQILTILFLAHCFMSVVGIMEQRHISAKLYKCFFGIEVLLFTAYVIYACMTWTCNGLVISCYAMIYYIIALNYFCIRHWTIDPDKEYEFIPKKAVDLGISGGAVEGYIVEDGLRITVYIDGEIGRMMSENGWREGSCYIVKYRERKRGSSRFDVIKTPFEIKRLQRFARHKVPK